MVRPLAELGFVLVLASLLPQHCCTEVKPHGLKKAFICFSFFSLPFLSFPSSFLLSLHLTYFFLFHISGPRSTVCILRGSTRCTRIQTGTWFLQLEAHIGLGKICTFLFFRCVTTVGRQWAGLPWFRFGDGGTTSVMIAMIRLCSFVPFLSSLFSFMYMPFFLLRLTITKTCEPPPFGLRFAIRYAMVMSSQRQRMRQSSRIDTAI